jgi:hypothetical protein
LTDSQRASPTQQSKRMPSQAAAAVRQGLVADGVPADLLALQRAVEDPAAASPGDILALQQVAGNRAVSSLIQTRRGVSPAAHHSESGVIQRAELSADQILTRLSGIPFVQKQLARRHALRRDPTKDPVMRDRVKAVLGQYEAELRATHDVPTRHGMILAVVLESVARVLAVNELNDPGLTPHLTEKLLELYGTEIRRSLQGMDQGQEALRLAGAMVSDDPVSLHMHNELDQDEAVRRIGEMAGKAGKGPDRWIDMFHLLRQRFEIQMAALTRADVQQQQAAGGGYSVREATGEISEAYFDKLFGTAAAPVWGGTGAARKLSFEAASQQRLDDLGVAVQAAGTAAAAPAPPGATAAVPAGLTPRQAEHLTKLGQGEHGIINATHDTRVAQELQQVMGGAAAFSLADAVKLREHIKASLHMLPITINANSERWFGARSQRKHGKKVPRRKYLEQMYRSGAGRRQETKYSKLFEKKRAKGAVKHLGLLEGGWFEGQNRTENYWRFRYWKDMAMTGNLGLSDEELPKFAGVNVASQALGSQASDPTKYGEAPYGDIHFVMNPARLAGRVVFTATDFGKPRTDIYLAFCDFLLGGGELIAGKETKDAGMVKMIINSLLTQRPVSWSKQPFEIQIFGNVSMTDDISEIWVAQTVPAKAVANIRYFAQQKCGNPPVRQDVAPADLQGASGWFTNPGAAGFKSQVQAAVTALP